MSQTELRAVVLAVGGGQDVGVQALTARLFDCGGYWHRVERTSARARALADRHYSRQTPGALEFMGPGRVLVLLTDDARAVWGAIENLDGGGALRWRCSLFRNEGPVLSSALVREATERTVTYWRTHYGRLPEASLTTEVDPSRTRHKRDPGRCFLRAGWRVVERTADGLLRLEAPT